MESRSKYAVLIGNHLWKSRELPIGDYIYKNSLMAVIWREHVDPPHNSDKTMTFSHVIQVWDLTKPNTKQLKFQWDSLITSRGLFNFS